MLIRHRLILWFIFFVTIVLLSFSFYIYYNYASDREDFFFDRLERRVIGTQQLFDPKGSLKGSINTILHEQVDMVFSGKDSLYYTNSTVYDYYPTEAFLDSVRQQGVIEFTYTTPYHKREKAGIAITYSVSFEPASSKPYVAIVTAFDTEGYQRQESLRDLLIYANLFCIIVVGLFAYFFSIRALYPLDALISQIKKRSTDSLAFRLKDFNPKDEVGTLAISFNELLDKHERLIDNQRAFISQASHELRTPMAAVKGLLETALYYEDDKENSQINQKKAIQELDRLISLSNGLLLLARVENEGNLIHSQKINILDVLMDCVEQMQSKWKQTPLLLTISDGVTLQTRSLEIWGEYSLLSAAITNIIDNACKYSHQQEVVISLEMNTESKLRLSIQDKGIGIPAEEINKIFQPLYRATNIGSRTGFGIGLTLAQNIIRLHKGQLSINSKPEEGTEIVIDLNFPLT